MREDRGWSQKYTHEQLHEGLGLKRDSRASYDRLERGPTPPSPDQQKFLIQFYGKSPDDLPDIVERPEPKDELIEALRAQTDAITALADAIAKDRDERKEWETGLLEGLRDLAQSAQGRGPSGGPGRKPRAAAQP
jgi:hypothetical protein